MKSRTSNYPRRGVPVPALLALAAAAVVAAGCSSNHDGGGDMPPPAANTAPAVSAITDRSVDQDTVIGPISFGITDTESDTNALTVTVAADSTNVFPADGLVLSGTGPTRMLTLTPLEAATGASAVTLTVSDPAGAATTRTFNVTVNAIAVSVRSAAVNTFAKAENDDPTPVNGYTFTQDADDETTFDALIGTEE